MKHQDLMEVKAALETANELLAELAPGSPRCIRVGAKVEAALAKLEAIEDPPRRLRDMEKEGRIKHLPWCTLLVENPIETVYCTCGVEPREASRGR